MTKLVLILFSALFAENAVFTKFYGLDPILGSSKSVKTAFGLGFGVTAVTTLSGVIVWPLYRFLLFPFDLLFLTTPLFLLVIAALVQTLEMVLEKHRPRLYHSLGIYLPLITVNCAIIATLRTLVSDFTPSFAHFFSGVFACFTSSLGFAFALLLFTGVRKRIQEEEIPVSFRGIPTVLITAGLVAIAFYGFSLLVF